MFWQYPVFFLFPFALVNAESVPHYHDGNFTYPDRFGISYAQGASITITWETLYNRSNLFYSQYNDDGNSVSIAANTEETSWTWTVSTTKTNLTLPFHFRIVDAEGSDDDQYYGGFWSGGFYIQAKSESSTAAESSTTSTASSSTSTIALTSAAATSQAVSTAATAVPTAQQTSSSSSSGYAISGGAIAGIAIGAIAALAFVGGGLFYLGRRRRRQDLEPPIKPNNGYEPAPPTYYNSNQWVEPPGSTHGPVELESMHSKVELGNDGRPVEMGESGRRY